VQLFSYSAVTWNPHRIHFDIPYAREEGHAGVAVQPHLRAALALRSVTEGLGPQWQVTHTSYRLRKPAYAPTQLRYGARVRSLVGDTMGLDPDAGALPGEVESRLRRNVAEMGLTNWDAPAEVGGSDPARAVRTRAERDGDDWLITGTKMWISGATESDYGIVVARTGDGRGGPSEVQKGVIARSLLGSAASLSGASR